MKPKKGKPSRVKLIFIPIICLLFFLHASRFTLHAPCHPSSPQYGAGGCQKQGGQSGAGEGCRVPR